MRGAFWWPNEYITSTQVKWKAINMKLAGHSKPDIMKILGIKNDTQIGTWMKIIEIVEEYIYVYNNEHLQLKLK